MSDKRLSKIGLGTMNFGVRTDSTEALAILEVSVGSGITLINTADVDYSGRSEQIVGQFIAAHNCRSELFLSAEIADKNLGVPHAPKLDAAHLVPAAANTLSRLNVDYVDRFFLPRPNFTIPIEQTLADANILIKKGFCKSIGVSTFPAWMTAKGIMAANANSDIAQISGELSPYNLLDRRCENARLPMTRNFGIEFFAWAPLAQGLLAGRYDDAIGDEVALPLDSRAKVLGGIYRERISSKAVEIARRFTALAKAQKIAPACAAIAWCLSAVGVTAAIVGPRTRDQMTEVIRAKNVQLAQAFLDQCDLLVPPGSARANFHNSAPWMLETL